MPEVPELNVVGLTLQKHFKGQKVKRIEILWKKRVKASEEEFNSALRGAALRSVDRNGKELHLHFDNDQILGIHMMLTGKMILLPTDQNLKNPIFELMFDNGAGIIVLDGMGQAKPILNPEIPPVPDIMADDFTEDYLGKVLSKAGGKIKEVLQKQDKIRGIGSAYADEILWSAKISPYSIAKNIPSSKVAELYSAIRTVTVEATEDLMKRKCDGVFEMENKDHRYVHNPAKTHSPEGEEIIVGKLGSGRTFYVESQVLY
ncbi:formamidopyrimidine-DNA glycosylase [Dyadobacter endophyticus]|uniref:Formamidopyrimidine-DNA glycosylase n=1 Tax=Dyadobacter endophyticus TaxID=1749036 RepID=A0ABQ1ZB11_9BACT|nr:DNA-formamidopyrimidine glycosylase family protein [Dyadobacter endophyticus]GGH55920.1 formamidopyrimidine-DNA glycosylase [Dyadobacter endophyticus]